MNLRAVLGFLVLCSLGCAEEAVSGPDAAPANPAPSEDYRGADVGAKADKPDEMFEKMRTAVEEIAGTYGDPPFIQIFTNDPKAAEAMQLKLRELGGDKAAKSELGALEKVRDKLNADLAKRAKEKKQLEDKIREQSRQLDDLAAAIARARALLDATAN
ncbi:MAG TPA: hypothetical protein VGG34_08555 [Opitutaceae bacterium]|jgi:hypothetical protein